MKSILTLLFALSVSICFSQDDYMKDIATKSCECLNSVNLEGKGSEQFNMELGLCMIQAAQPYEKELLRDYKIDFAKIDQQGEELGRIIGMKMATVCPQDLMVIASRLESDDIKSNDVSSNSEITGKITGIQEKDFVTFIVRDNKGNMKRLLWMAPIKLYGKYGNLSRDYKLFLSERATITYDTQEYFDFEKKTHRMYNVIKSISILD